VLLDTLPEVKALSREQKCQLMDELWTDIHDAPEDKQRDAAIGELLEKRYAEFLANPEAGITFAEHKARLEDAKCVLRDARGRKRSSSQEGRTTSS
jgi:hypothetical protein